jgi:hypothetical protein
MATDRPIDTLVLQEFRLRAAGDGPDAEVAATVPDGGWGEAIPLLTSIADRQDVALVRGLRDGDPEPGERDRVALAPFASSWPDARRYAVRVAERSARAPEQHRLAVTESGIRDTFEPPVPAAPSEPLTAGATLAARLLWIGVPLGTHAGLLVLIGTDRDLPGARAAPPDWPLPLSEALGVRIYESGV